MSDNFLTIKEAANTLGVHWQTIRNYIHSGTLPALKIGRTLRVRETDLQKLVSENPNKTSRLHEIEFRFLLNDKEEIEDKVRKLGGKIVQHTHIVDHYFIPVNIHNKEAQDNWYSSKEGFTLRIRSMDNDYSGRSQLSLEVKKPFHPGNHSNLLESEIVIHDYDETKSLLELMGYKELVTIDKERLVYRYKDMKLCFDHIKGWGDALEIEVKTELMYGEIKAQIFELAHKLGLKDSNYIKTSHTRLAMETLMRF